MPPITVLSVTGKGAMPPISKHFVLSALVDGRLAHCLVDNGCMSIPVDEHWALRNPVVRYTRLQKPVLTTGYNRKAGEEIRQQAHITDFDINGHHETLNA